MVFNNNIASRDFYNMIIVTIESYEIMLANINRTLGFCGSVTWNFRVRAVISEDAV